MRLIAAGVLGCWLWTGTAFAQYGGSSSLIARARDGGWYADTEDQAYYPNPKSTVRKYLPDFRTVVWEREVSGYYPREVRATPDGGAALLGVQPGGKGSLSAWDADGNFRFSAVVDLFAVAESALPIAHFAVEPEGSFLVVNGSTRYERSQQPFTNGYRVSGGSLDVFRISAQGNQLAHAVLPIQSSSVAGVELDGVGRVFVAGSSESDDLPVSAGAVQTRRLGGDCRWGISMPSTAPCNSGWVARLDARSLEIRALTYVGGPVENILTSLAIDRNGFPVVAGYTGERFGGVENPYPRTEGTVEPSSTRAFRSVATITRLSPDLDSLLDSTWLEGAARTSGQALAIDSHNRIVLGGITAAEAPMASLSEWSRACGPYQSQSSWGFLIRLTEHMETIDRVIQFDRRANGRIAFDDADNPAVATDDGVVPFESRVSCLKNGASFSFTSIAAPGELMTVHGGPFAGDELVTLGEADATVLARSSTAIQFVTPRPLEFGRFAELRIGGELARTLKIVSAQPTWKAALTPDGRLIESGNYLIEALRSDGLPNSYANPLRPNEEVRAYATGIDLSKPLRIFLGYPTRDLAFIAEYVPDTGEGIVEFRFVNPYPTLTSGGLAVIYIENDGIRGSINPGFILNPFQ